MNQEKKTFDQFYLHPLKAYVFKFGQRDWTSGSHLASAYSVNLTLELKSETSILYTA